MPFVLTVDQIESRRAATWSTPSIHELAAIEVLLPFTRTVGDEFQGLLADPLSVVDCHPDDHAWRAVAHRVGHRDG